MSRAKTTSLFIAVFLCSVTVALAKLPSWDTVKPPQARFKVLPAFAGEAVVDRETGLVWELTWNGSATFRAALRQCALSTVGGRAGWRLPAVEELTSLVDPTQTAPALPPGHPFASVSISNDYWTANEEELDTSMAVTVSFNVFGVDSASKTSSRPFVCVRGGRGSTVGTRGGI
ncbi:MAG TPA: DUF1566 domain-containing protein [Candidatus Limnocylindrales bacterium]|nr:DUF1566 domain-containing protein [Candidatus Limnocylindrales bacterium]